MEINEKNKYSNIDFIIADILNGNSKKYNNSEIEKYIKLFCLDKIKDYYSDYDVIIMNKKSMNELFPIKNTNGLTKEKNIFLKREKVLGIKNKNIDIIRTIMHEVEHVKQNYLLENNDISYISYLTLRDEILSYKIGNNYYNDNYEYIFFEADAKLNAELELYYFLLNYCPNLLYKELDNIIENILQCEKNLLINYRIINGIKYDTEELFDIVIENNSYLIKECPLLNFYYNQDGSKILLGELIERRTSFTSNKNDFILVDKLKKLDNFIIKNRRGSNENLKKDIESVLKLNDESNNNIVLMLYDRINNRDINDLSLVYDLLKDNELKKHIIMSKIVAEKSVTKVYEIINK